MISPYEQKTTIQNNRQAQACFGRLLVETRACKDILRRSVASADRPHNKREASSGTLLGRSKPPPINRWGISSLLWGRGNDWRLERSGCRLRFSGHARE